MSGFYRYQLEIKNVDEINFYYWKQPFHNENSFKPLLHHLSKSKNQRHLIFKLKEKKALCKVVQPEIIKEMKLAIQECGRKLSLYVARKRVVKDEMRKRGYIEKYLPFVAEALHEIIGINKVEQDQVSTLLKEMLEQTRVMPKLKNRDVDETAGAFDSEETIPEDGVEMENYSEDDDIPPEDENYSDDDMDDDSGSDKE